MLLRRALVLLATLSVLGGGELLLAKKAAARRTVAIECGKDKKACLNDKNCLCYCSRKCGPRKKLPDDEPVYVENDPNGKYCYCKPWDRDKFEEQKCAEREQERDAARK